MKRRRAPRIHWRRPSRSTLGWLAAFSGAAAMQVLVNLKTTELGYELGSLRHILARLASEQADLKAELATVTSPQALDLAARTRLGLRAPREGQIVGVP